MSENKTDDKLAAVVQKITKVLGFNPMKKGTPSSEAMSRVVEKIQKDRDEKLEAEAEKKFLALVEKTEAFAKVEREFNSNKAKFVKEAEKEAAAIQRMLGGETVEDEPEETEEKPKD